MEKVILRRVNVWTRTEESGAHRVWVIEKIKFHFHF